MPVIKAWEELESECGNCTRCELCKTRNNVVFGRGNKEAKVLLVGEGPRHQENIDRKPSVEQAGKLLDVLLCVLEISQKDIYIASQTKDG